MLIIIVSLHILQYKYYHGITICNVRFYYKGSHNRECAAWVKISFVLLFVLLNHFIYYGSVNSSCLYVLMLEIVFFVYRNNYSIILKQPIKGIVYQEVGLPLATPLSKNQPEI